MGRLSRILLIALVCLLLLGCQQPLSTVVTTQQTDGKVTSVKIEMRPGTTYQFDNMQDLDQFIASMEATVGDLKLIRTQMPVKEPPVK